MNIDKINNIMANFSLSGVGGETRSPMEWRSRLEEARGKDPYVDYVLALRRYAPLISTNPMSIPGLLAS